MRFTPQPIHLYFNAMKTTLKHLSSLLMITVLLTGCFRNDIRTQTFHIDQLQTQESARLVANALRGLRGIQTVQPDLQDRTCTVVFDGRQLYLKNIEFAIVKAGFDLPHWPAKTADKAKLPEELR